MAERMTNNSASRPIFVGLITVIALSLLIASVCAFIVLAKGRFYPVYSRMALQHQLLAQQIHLDGMSSQQGDQAALQRLERGLASVDANVASLVQGDAGIPAAADSFGEQVQSLQENWQTALPDYRALLGQGNAAAQREQKAKRLDFQISQSQSVVESHLRKVLARDWERPEARAEMAILAQKIAQLRLILLGIGDNTPKAIAPLRADIDKRLEAMLAKGVSGGVVLSKRGVREGLATVRESIARISTDIDAAAERLLAEDVTTTELHDHRAALIGDGQALATRVSIEQNKLRLLENTAIIAGLVMMLATLGLAALMWRRSNRKEGKSASQEQQDHRAITRLLDEMIDLADGDLRVEATVNEDITGAIADAVNYAVESLRDLVSTIDRSAQQVRHSVKLTGTNAKALVDASAVQAREVGEASKALDQAATSMRESASQADETVRVALASVETAGHGTVAVQNLSTAMVGIREHIQESSKRLKRLGESSQEINDINSLIEEIAGRTAILSLNASLKTGDAQPGGFEQVSAEIKRLSEKVGDATKRIEEIVSHIQEDTQEAMASMERSTAGVVKGTELAEHAGAALQEIETVSKQAAGMTSEISESCKQQAQVANSVSKTMNVIRNITRTSVRSTIETAKAVSRLNQLSGQLSESIAGFRMPDAETTGGDHPMEYSTDENVNAAGGVTEGAGQSSSGQPRA